MNAHALHLAKRGFMVSHQRAERPRVTRNRCLVATAAIAMSLALSGCGEDQAKAPPEQPRLVRTVTVERLPPPKSLAFTGHIEARDSVDMSFRIGGRLAGRDVRVGAQVNEGDVIAHLDPENELNDLRSARAALAAAEGQLRAADNHYQRQRHLLGRNVASQAEFEAAEQGRVSAQAQVAAARARVASAEDVVGFTTLRADAPGIVTRIGVEPGEVVAPGRMVVQLARRDGRDAVFAAPADTVRSLHLDTPAQVTLAGDPAIAAHGRVREISPEADPVTRTFTVRVGISAPPPAFRLGAAVAVRTGDDVAHDIRIPATALTRAQNDKAQADNSQSVKDQPPAVWVVDPAKRTVSLRPVVVLDADPAVARIGKGLEVGDIVVTAGAGLLRDGQQVRLVN